MPNISGAMVRRGGAGAHRHADSVRPGARLEPAKDRRARIPTEVGTAVPQRQARRLRLAGQDVHHHCRHGRGAVGEGEAGADTGETEQAADGAARKERRSEQHEARGAERHGSVQPPLAAVLRGEADVVRCGGRKDVWDCGEQDREVRVGVRGAQEV